MSRLLYPTELKARGFKSWIAATLWRQSSGSPCRTRTYDSAVNSRVLYQLS